MPYRQLALSPAVPTAVERFIRKHLDMQFHDVHCMLRLPLPDHGLTAGCNFAATTVLLAIIAGMSTVLYQQAGGTRAVFCGMLERYYPWDHESLMDISAAEVANDIYGLFRNPLVHGLGLDTRKCADGGWRWRTRDLRVRIGRSDRGRSEAELEELEQSHARPVFAWTTVVVEPGFRTLWVEGLYWGTRRLVRSLTEDHEMMTRAETFLLRR